jgi:lipid-binding SYLF domain-containing protein
MKAVSLLTWMMAAAVTWTMATGAGAADRSQLERDAKAALGTLVAGNAGAKALNGKAVAVLVFPSITKAGLGIGGQTGDGVLFRGGKAVAYYNTSGASYGLQAGIQRYGYAMFFMNEPALKQLNRTDGFEIGVGPSVVVADEGFGRSVSTMTYDQDIYAFIFSQKGLMAGVGLQGNKISRLDK